MTMYVWSLEYSDNNKLVLVPNLNKKSSKLFFIKKIKNECQRLIIVSAFYSYLIYLIRI